MIVNYLCLAIIYACSKFQKFSGGTCPRTPLASSGLRPSISSLMEKFILVETSHEKCWIDPWFYASVRDGANFKLSQFNFCP